MKKAGTLLLVNLLQLRLPSANMFLFASASKTEMVSPSSALPGRDEAVRVSPSHAVNGNPTVPPFPTNTEMAMFGMGCFWGAERKFWTQNGVFSTQVGYAAGYTKNPTYKEVCTGKTGHGEVVRVVFDPTKIDYSELLKVFWENHNPTHGMRQGNDVGTQYRSGIYYYSQAFTTTVRHRSRRPRPVARNIRKHWIKQDMEKLLQRLKRLQSSTMLKTITSSIYTRTQMDTVGWGARGSAVPWASRLPNRKMMNCDDYLFKFLRKLGNFWEIG